MLVDINGSADNEMTWESFQKEQSDRLDELCPSAQTLIFCNEQSDEFIKAFAIFLQSEGRRHQKDIEKLEADLAGLRMIAEKRGFEIPQLEHDIWTEVGDNPLTRSKL